MDQGHTTSEVSRSLEISANMLRRWIREYQAGEADQSFRSNGKLTPEQEEIRQLKVQIRQLKLERQILKEATGIEAKKRSEIFVHHPKEEDLSGWLDVPTYGCESQRLL
ncbi:transposase [Nitrosomonas ureae]|uniref:Transposase n=1 Tax=Nitrosomonas ureae TaxID=44577 RepID=A0A1H2E0F9_9PROT|nr:transposase [Nitrosomonas ureae]